MEIVILLAIVGLWVLVAARWWSDRRTSPPPSTALEPVAEPSPEPGVQPDLVAKEADGAVELWWPGGGRLATVSPTTKRTAGAALRSPWARRAVGSLVRRAVPRRAGGDQRYRITFPPDLMNTIATGGTVEVALGGRAMPALGGAALGGPTMALAAGALAMSVAQQQRLDRTLAAIEKRLDLIIDRMRDDDLGRLDATDDLLHQLDGRSAELPPQQLRVELAAARQAVDAVYFARRRFAERLADAIGDAQETAMADNGEAQAWADGVLDAVGDPTQLRSELLVYLRALVVRSQLATSTSGVLAVDGYIDDANRLLADTVAELRGDFYALYRRFRPLAQWAPKRSMPWKRRDWDRAHSAVVEVYELMAGEVEPLLPEEHTKPLELEAVLDDDGAVAELRVVDES